MSGARVIHVLLIVALVGTYGYRAVTGVWAGWALYRGHVLRNMSEYEDSAPLLESAAVGFNTTRALLMAGDAWIDVWEEEIRWDGAVGEGPEKLVLAAQNFFACLCNAPAARGPWKGLGEVYDALEWIGREKRSETPWTPPEHPWGGVGRSGRIAVGLNNLAIEHSPNWGDVYDDLALILWNYGIYDESKVAVRESAKVVPLYYDHVYHKISELPAWVDTEFAAGSREVLGSVPLFPRGAHLVELGKLERRIGANARAIEALQEAIEDGGDKLRLAEASFHLGLALIAEERFQEGRARLATALEHPIFRASALRALATTATRLGNDAEALQQLRLLRREQPDELWASLEFAAVARRLQDWHAALESLRWAKLTHGDLPDPYAALARTHLEMGQLGAATTVVDELEEALGAEAAEVTAALRREISRQSRSH